MNSDVLQIVLTDNSWLYAGLAALMPEMLCLQAGFCAHRLPREVWVARRIIIAVDSRIVFRGEWTVFNALQVLRPDATTVWLTREETGRVFPAGSRGDRIVAQKQNIVSLRLALRRLSLWADPRREEVRVAGNGLTLTERRLLPLFLSGMRVPALSRLTGRPVKTLYTHRHKILAKTGFRQMVFLQFVYERNGGLPGIPELETPDDTTPGNQEEEDTGECTV
ncbi:helix-turn-helix transcriptional regulator [Cedecea davisae]|uniref:helix-turn-helix transcriptional regulator n=1 Tax=Cedecea davisae TaxID=158484 RepID=UPI00242A3C32|nr:transcriptional regulator [Cedecea davisae]